MKAERAKYEEGHQALSRVAGGNRGCRLCRKWSEQVNEERTDEDAWPDPVSQQQSGSDRYAGGRPHRGNAGVQVGEGKTNPGSDEIDRSHGEDFNRELEIMRGLLG